MNFFIYYIKIIDCLTETLITDLIMGCKILDNSKFQSNFKLSDRSKKFCIAHMKVATIFKYKEIENYVNKISDLLMQSRSDSLTEEDICSLIKYTKPKRITEIT